MRPEVASMANTGAAAPRHSVTVAPGTPVTWRRPVATDDLSSYVDKPHMPRAEVAADREHPNGSKGHVTGGMTVLQQHFAFFDRNNDGIIYPWETYEGFRAVGFNMLLSFFGMLIINGSFSYFTLDGWIPSPFFPIYIRNAHKGKHGSDSEVYDTEGRFVPQKFEELFSKYDRDRKGGLTLMEMLEMTEANRNVMDFFGWVASKLEWGATWLLCRDDRGVVTKEQIRGIFDGSFFERMEKQRRVGIKEYRQY
ncbi:unnamed protein product [Closterium sp. Naga37s-1]|nr:unnamed protein product [Closterium sp. Naga37s-1]